MDGAHAIRRQRTLADHGIARVVGNRHQQRRLVARGAEHLVAMADIGSFEKLRIAQVLQVVHHADHRHPGLGIGRGRERAEQQLGADITQQAHGLGAATVPHQAVADTGREGADAPGKVARQPARHAHPQGGTRGSGLRSTQHQAALDVGGVQGSELVVRLGPREQHEAGLGSQDGKTAQQLQYEDLGPAIFTPGQDRGEVNRHDFRVAHHLLNLYRAGPAKGAEFNAIGKAA